jgi:hypothetical protein
MIWAKSFREAFCGHVACDPDDYEQHALRLGLHRRALPVAILLRAVFPSYFAVELRTLHFLGNARSLEEFRSELDSYRSHYRRHGGILRNVLAARLSGRRLMHLADELRAELQRNLTS